MRVIKAMGKAMLVMAFLILITMLITAIIQASRISPITALAIVLFIGLFAAITIWFYVTDNK